MSGFWTGESFVQMCFAKSTCLHQHPSKSWNNGMILLEVTLNVILNILGNILIGLYHFLKYCFFHNSNDDEGDGFCSRCDLSLSHKVSFLVGKQYSTEKKQKDHKF